MFVLAHAAWQQNQPQRATWIGRAIVKRALKEEWLDLEIDTVAMLGKQYLKLNLPARAVSALEVVIGLPRHTSRAWAAAAYNLGVALWRDDTTKRK
ncbi:hypothetical protein [Sulfobacillus thermosulfidooxidans]|uniref:hypothetical protein n=1 Tax=Sulfobacillus thermosulfidooxidans TaxID=28034 RepID=UPI0002F5FA14|nr:hypothetical protein [Sulfobacillus thermosulfidooxidans]